MFLVRRQFNEDLPTLANRLTIQYGGTETPDYLSYPTLSHIPMEDIVKKVNTIQPKEVMALERTFLTTGFISQVYDAELPFVRNLEQVLAQKNNNKTTYADILIEDHLKGVIKKIQKWGAMVTTAGFKRQGYPFATAKTAVTFCLVGCRFSFFFYRAHI